MTNEVKEPSPNSQGYIPGWAFAVPEARVPYEQAWQRVKDLYPKAILRKTSSYAQNRVLLDEELTKNLTPFEKLVLADRGNACFGGVVQGDSVTVYTD